MCVCVVGLVYIYMCALSNLHEDLGLIYQTQNKKLYQIWFYLHITNMHHVLRDEMRDVNTLQGFSHMISVGLVKPDL